MSFKKQEAKPPVVATPIDHLSWDEPSRRQQSMWFAITEWDFKVFPMLQAQAGMQFMFQVEGRITNGPLKDCRMAGEVEVLDDPLDVPGMFKDRWQNVPEVVEGYGFLMESEDRSVQPSFGLTLYCTLPALDWIHRGFANGFHSRHGGVGIEVSFDCPNNTGGSFWESRWRKEWLRVLSWKLFSGSARKGE